MSRFLNQKYSSIEPYTPGEQPKVNGRLIKLNTNENPYPPAPGVMKVINDKELAKLRLYSDPEAADLVDAIAENFGISKDQVITTNGSDEILAFIFMAFQGASGKVYYPEISYSFYPVYCDVFGAQGVKIPLQEDFSIRPEDYYDVDGLIVITNPNAPTGMALTLDQIESILVHNINNLIVIDEAYVDFGAESAVKLIDKYDNLLVVQTFSKSRSLAGSRIGYAMGNSEIIADLNAIKFSFNPYNLDRLAILAGTEAMKDKAYFNETCRKIIDTRENFVAKMTEMGFEVLPSKANFVFATSPAISGKEYFTKLREDNIIVRYFDKPKISDYVRITIGTSEEMELLLEKTKEILEEIKKEQ